MSKGKKFIGDEENSRAIQRIQAILKKMQWCGTSVEEDWQPDGDGSRYYEGISICPVCGGREVNKSYIEDVKLGLRTENPAYGHRKTCELGKLCAEVEG